MDRCWLHALSCALGYNIRWLMRSLVAKARRALLWPDMCGAAAPQGRLASGPLRWAIR